MSTSTENRGSQTTGDGRKRRTRTRIASGGMALLGLIGTLVPLAGVLIGAQPASAAGDASVYIGVTSGSQLLFYDTVTGQLFNGPTDPAGRIPYSVSAESSGNLLVDATSSLANGFSEARQVALPAGTGGYGPNSEVSTNDHGIIFADPNTTDAVAGTGTGGGTDVVSETNPVNVTNTSGDPFTLNAVTAANAANLDPANTLDTSGMYALITGSSGVSVARYNTSGAQAGHFIYNHSMYARLGGASAPTVLVGNGAANEAGVIAGGLAFDPADPATIETVFYDPSNQTNYLQTLYLDNSARPTEDTSDGPSLTLPSVPGQVTGVTLSPDECSVYVTSQPTSGAVATLAGTLTQISVCVSTGVNVGGFMRQWKTGAEPISPTVVGNAVFTANQGANSLTDIDTVSGNLKVIPTGSLSPDSLAPGQAMTGATVAPIDQSVFIGGNAPNFWDYYDATQQTLSTSALSPSNNQLHPAQVAGNGTSQILVGESSSISAANDEVDAYNTMTQSTSQGIVESPPLAGTAISHVAYSPDGTIGSVSDVSGAAATISVNSPTAASSMTNHYTLAGGDSYTVAALLTTPVADAIWGPNAQPGSDVFAIVREADGKLGWRRADPGTGQFFKGLTYSGLGSGFNTELAISDGTDQTGLSSVGLFYSPSAASSVNNLAPELVALTYDPTAGANQGTWVSDAGMFTGNQNAAGNSLKTSIPANEVPESAAMSPDGCTLWVTALDSSGNFSWLYGLKMCVTVSNGFGTGNGTTMSFKNAVAMTTDANDDIFVASTSPSNELTDITAGATGAIKTAALGYTPSSLAVAATPAPNLTPSISVSLQASAPSTPAGIRSIALDNNGNLPTVAQQNAAGSSSTSVSPNAGVAATKLSAIKLSAIKLSAIKLSAIKLSAIKLSAIALGSSSAAKSGLNNILLSNIGVTYPDGCAGASCKNWKGILAGSRFADQPLQSVTLQDVLATTGSDQPDGLNPEVRFDALPLADIDVSGSSLGSFPVAAYATGGETIADIPLNATDATPNAILTTWCNDLNALHHPCSQLSIDPSNPASAADVTLLSLGLAGVPLEQLPIDSIPLNANTVANSPVQSIKLSAIGIADTGIGTVKLSAMKLSAIKLGAIKLSAIKLSAISLGAIKLSAIKLSAIKLSAIKLSAIKLSAIKLSAIGIGATKLSAINLSASKLSAIKLSAISTVNSLVNCGAGAGLIDCSAAGGKTLGDAATASALQPGGDLTTLQAGISATNPDSNWTAASMSDVFAGTDTGGTETLLDLENLANSQANSGNPALLNLFNLIALADAGGIDDQTSLSDVESNLLAPTTDNTALQDLLANESADNLTTVADIINEIAADDAAALNGLFLGDLLAGLVPESTFPWTDVNLSTPGLATASTDGGQVTLTATSAVTNGPAALTYALTVPAGFSLVSGSALFDGAPAPDPSLSGNTLTASPGNSAGNDTYAVTVRPNEILGGQNASVVASLPGNVTASASANMNITDPFAGNTSSAAAATLVPDTLNLSFLASPTTSAYWDINVPAGDELALDLSDLPADYDLVLYGPPATQLGTQAVQSTRGVTEVPPGEQTASGQQSVPNQGDLPILTTNPIQAVSSSRGLVSEEIDTPQLSGGTYIVQVSGYNGAHSTTAPYALRAELVQTPASPACAVPTYPNGLHDAANPFGDNQALPAPAAYLANHDANGNSVAPNTLFLVNPDRLYQAYGATNASAIMTAVANTAKDTAANGMSGVVVPVEGDAITAADYAGWDQSPCSVAAANKVVADIDAVVRGILSAHPTIRYIDIVGSDDQIPMARIPDQTVTDNESDYAAGTLAGINDQLAAALSTGNFLSDDPYASPTPLGVGGQSLYTPSMVVGRLVESPSQIENALSRYQSTNGQLDASSALSTGYDFLTQGANAIATDLSQPRAANKVSSLINDSFSAADLKSALDGTAAADQGSVPRVQSINGHFDFSRMLSGAGDSLPENATQAQVDAEILQTTDVTGDSHANGLAGALLFSMGCHSGLNIPDFEIQNAVPGGLDSWAKTFANEGALWVANTGYGYANDQFIAYSARLMGLFSGYLDGNLSIGQALAQAKQRYAADTGILDPYDLKAAMESTFYGIPNYKLNGTTAPTGSPSIPQLNTGTDPATGLTVATTTVHLPVASAGDTTTAGQYGAIFPSEGGTYYQVNGSTDEQVSNGFPIEPLVRQDVTLPGPNGSLSSVAHGSLVTGLTSVDVGSETHGGNTAPFGPSIAEAQSDLAANEHGTPEFETAFPATLQRVATFQLFDPSTGNPVTHQEVNLITGQFIPDPANPGQGTQRLFTNLNSMIEYAPGSDMKFTAPTINESQGFIEGSGANQTADFNVLATPAPGGSSVKEVLVLYTDTTSPGVWTPVTLSQGADGAWTGGGAAPSSAKISYIVQAVDGDGNVAMASNKGVDFNQVATTQAKGLNASATGATQTNGYYNGNVTLTVTGPSGSTITYQVDGGTPQNATSPAGISVTGDGSHVVTASDGMGDTLTQVVAIDSSAPVISTQLTAPRVSANGYTSGGATLVITAADGGSGVKTLTAAAGSGPANPVTGPITPPSGTTNYTIVATDFVGHTATTTLTVKVDVTGPAVSCGTADGSWNTTDQSVTCTGTDTQSGVAPPNPITLSTSVPPGTAAANASTNAGQICDLLSNCTPAGPISGFKIDKATPTVNCPTSDTSWHTSPVVFTCTASDVGSGLSGQSSVTLTATAPAGTSNANASTNAVAVCDVAGNCVQAGPISGVMVDNSAPSVSCPSADTNWHGGSVSFTCTAIDSGSGLAHNTVVLVAQLPPNQSSAHVSTNTAQLCDEVGNCSTAGPITGVMIDNAAPSVSCPGADSTWHKGVVSFVCTTGDAGSGLANASDSSITLIASISAGTQSNNVSSTNAMVCDNLGNCSGVGPITHVMIDNTVPVVTCPAAGSNWHQGPAQFTCGATDTGSGLASSSPITLTANGPNGVATPSVSTNTTSVCDAAGNCATAGPITNVMVDNSSPVPTCPTADTQWHTGVVTFTCTGTDTGSGLVIPTGTVLNAVLPPGQSSATVSTNTDSMCDNVGNCTLTGPITNVKIDNAAPTVICPTADNNWHAGTVTFTCTASDGGSGLANPSQATITLTASIPDNTGNGNVSTNSVKVCDNVGNCATAGPITNVKIDNAAPQISVTSPTMHQVVIVNGRLSAGYACSESGVGIASCTATLGGNPVANGASLPTGTVGSYTLKVTAVSVSGKTTVLSVTYVVSYAICNFLPPVTPLALLGTVTFAVTVCDASGKSVGGGSVAITAVDVDGSLPPNGVLGNGFKWVPVTNLYAFVMAQFSLAKGNHVLDVTVTGDPTVHPLAFSLT